MTTTTINFPELIGPETLFMRAGMPINPRAKVLTWPDYEAMWVEALRQCDYEPTDGWLRLMEQQHIDVYDPRARIAKYATSAWIWRRRTEFDIRQYFQGNGPAQLVNNAEAASTVKNMITAYERGVPLEDIIA